jgi:hypothetical protein
MVVERKQSQSNKIIMMPLLPTHQMMMISTYVTLLAYSAVVDGDDN